MFHITLFILNIASFIALPKYNSFITIFFNSIFLSIVIFVTFVVIILFISYTILLFSIITFFFLTFDSHFTMPDHLCLVLLVIIYLNYMQGQKKLKQKSRDSFLNFELI